MGKHWIRQQIRHDDVHDTFDKAVVWVQANRQAAGMAAGAAVLAVLVVSLIFFQRTAARTASWERLGLAQSYAYSGRQDASLEQLKQLAADYPTSDAAGFGELFAGDLLYQGGKFKQATEHYTKLLDRGAPKALQPVALNDLALAQESDGQPQLAVQTAQRFLETYSEHFLAPQIHACLARCLQALGQADQAKAAYQKISLQYPDTSWAAWAQSRLKGS